MSGDDDLSHLSLLELYREETRTQTQALSERLLAFRDTSGKLGLIDEVCWYFPELKFVTRHGCEPWTDLAVKLLLKWPNLYYSTSAFAPKHYPQAIIDYANTRGADKIMYAGYYPMGLSLERIFSEMPNVGFRDHVWPKFLRENAARVLGIGAALT